MSRNGIMTRDEADADKVGQCMCGLTGRWRHQRVSSPGAMPEQRVRMKFECLGGRAGPQVPRDAS
jgi:hypothetical protein